ncbi:hypothetical protein [Marinomonas fungiae]|uniref:hypothetical protein n=1 Tax=Marinomonas fungiae TaxID=1137284 RepID=UPI003A95ADB0
MQNSLQREVTLDQELAEIRAELACLYELGSSSSNLHDADSSDEGYMDMLSEF